MSCFSIFEMIECLLPPPLADLFDLLDLSDLYDF